MSVQLCVGESFFDEFAAGLPDVGVGPGVSVGRDLGANVSDEIALHGALTSESGWLPQQAGCVLQGGMIENPGSSTGNSGLDNPPPLCYKPASGEKAASGLPAVSCPNIADNHVRTSPKPWHAITCHDRTRHSWPTGSNASAAEPGRTVRAHPAFTDDQGDFPQQHSHTTSTVPRYVAQRRDTFSCSEG